MKNKQIFPIVLAVGLAGIALCAECTVPPSTIYYISLFPGANCDFEYAYPICDEGHGQQCHLYSLAIDDIVYVSKRIQGGPCLVYPSYNN